MNMKSVENKTIDTIKQNLNFSHIHYYRFEARLNSFQRWSKQIGPRKHDLAKSGFFCTERGDIVQCFCCGVKVCELESNNDSFEEHYKHSSKCDFLAMIGYRAPFPLSYSDQDRSSGSSLTVNTTDCDWSPFSSPLPGDLLIKNNYGPTTDSVPSRFVL